MSAEVRTSLTEFIVGNYLFGDAGRAPRDDESLVEAGIVDSTGILEMIEFLETAFGIEVTEAETVPENLDSVARLAAFVARKTGDRVLSAPSSS